MSKPLILGFLLYFLRPKLSKIACVLEDLNEVVFAQCLVACQSNLAHVLNDLLYILFFGDLVDVDLLDLSEDIFDFL